MSSVLNGSGARVDIKLRKGSTFTRVVTLADEDTGAAINISTRTYAAQIRKQKDASLVATMTCAVVDGPNGQFSLTLSAATTSALPLGERLIWDCEETDGSTVNPLFFGDVTVMSEVTQ